MDGMDDICTLHSLAIRRCGPISPPLQRLAKRVSAHRVRVSRHQTLARTSPLRMRSSWLRRCGRIGSVRNEDGWKGMSMLLKRKARHGDGPFESGMAGFRPSIPYGRFTMVLIAPGGPGNMRAAESMGMIGSNQTRSPSRSRTSESR